jgi:hypothetical protein
MRCRASENIAAYLDTYTNLEGLFYGCEVSHISQGSNEEANALANIGSQCLPVPPGVFWMSSRNVPSRNQSLRQLRSRRKEKHQSEKLKANSGATLAPEEEEEAKEKEPEEVPS